MKRIVQVTHFVEIEVDESKFTPEFMDEFRRNFYQLNTIEDHIKYLAGIEVSNNYDSFLEGYGSLDDFCICMHITDCEVCINDEAQK